MSAAKTAFTGPRYHFFWAGVARSHGLSAAIVHNQMDFLSRVVAKGGPVAVSIGTLAQHYPYLAPSTVHQSLAILTQEHRGRKPLLVRESLPGSRKLRYRTTGPAKARHRLVALDTVVATAHGVVAGIVYANIVRRILREWVAGDDGADSVADVNNNAAFSALVDRHRWSVGDWHRWHTFISFRTVRRAFAELVTAGLLVKLGRMFVWSPPPPGCAFYVPLPHRPGAVKSETETSWMLLDDEIVVATE